MEDTCECGTSPAPRAIDNGKSIVPVCEACWTDPENIAVDVLVDVATRAWVNGSPFVAHADLDPFVVDCMAIALAAALADRDMADDDGAIARLVAARWNEWYTA